MTALHHSSRIASITLTELLLVSGADRQARDKQGRTPLDCVPEDRPELAYRMRIFNQVSTTCLQTDQHDMGRRSWGMCGRA